MYLVEDRGGAIALMIGALCLLGTWPAILNYLERRGRLLQHTFIDYSFTNFLGAMVIALTFGQIGEPLDGKPNFLTQLGQDNGASVAFALVGGLLLSMGNLAIQYAWPFVGLSVTGVISSSIAVIVGTTCNYFLDERINRADVLFTGVGCFVIAVLLGSLLHTSNSADTKKKLCSTQKEGKEIEMSPFYPEGNEVHPLQVSPEEDVEIASLPPETQVGRDGWIRLPTSSNDQGVTPQSGTAEYFMELDEKRAVKIGSASYLFGIGIVFFAGTCFAIFSPAFNLATNDQWHTLAPGVPKLVVYTGFFYFSTAALCFGVVTNMYFLYFPMLGLPKSSISAYLNDWDGRLWALLAGVLCSLGNGLQFMGGQAAGYAAADAVQALPLVSTFWGILVFKEYHRSSCKTYVYLVLMVLMFMVAVVLLVSSAGVRKS